MVAASERPALHCWDTDAVRGEARVNKKDLPPGEFLCGRQGLILRPFRGRAVLGGGGKEAAEMLGTSLSGMKSRVQRGREKIRHMFEECCEISVDCRGRVVDCQARDLEQVPEDCRGAAASWAARHPPK
jgi:hypothetical protein